MKEIMDTVRRAVQAWRSIYPLSDETEKEIGVMLKTVRESLIKQVPMEPINDNCGDCGVDIRNWTGDEPFDYCPNCGQAINWEEEEE